MLTSQQTHPKLYSTPCAILGVVLQNIVMALDFTMFYREKSINDYFRFIVRKPCHCTEEKKFNKDW